MVINLPIFRRTLAKVKKKSDGGNDRRGAGRRTHVAKPKLPSATHAARVARSRPKPTAMTTASCTNLLRSQHFPHLLIENANYVVPKFPTSFPRNFHEAGTQTRHRPRKVDLRYAPNCGRCLVSRMLNLCILACNLCALF